MNWETKIPAEVLDPACKAGQLTHPHLTTTLLNIEERETILKHWAG